LAVEISKAVGMKVDERVLDIRQLEVDEDVLIRRNLKVLGMEEVYLTEIHYADLEIRGAKALIVPPAAGASALVIRDTGDISNRIILLEGGHIVIPVAAEQFIGGYGGNYPDRVNLSGKEVVRLLGNAYFDGTNWRLLDTVLGRAWSINADPSLDQIKVFRGTGDPITWTELARMTSTSFSLGGLKLIFGPLGAEDVNLYRVAPDTLQTDDEFRAFRLRSRLAGLPRTDLWDDGGIYQYPLDADSIDTLRDSPPFMQRGKYWDGTTSISRDAEVFHRMLSTIPTSEITFRIAGTDYFRIGDDGVITHKDILPDADNVRVLGSPTLRYANLYAVTTTIGDLILEGKNAKWRIFEREDGLYARNERTGKLYKIKLEECVERVRAT